MGVTVAKVVYQQTPSWLDNRGNEKIGIGGCHSVSFCDLELSEEKRDADDAGVNLSIWGKKSEEF